MKNENTNDLVNVIKTNYFSAQKGTVENPQAVAGAIRSALEGAVKLFWQKKYDKIPVWINGNREEFSLYEAINSVRFTKFFNTLEISDMNLIRKMCNDVLHGNVVFTVEIASELLSRLEKCIKAIEREIDMKIITGVSISTVPVESIVLDKNELKLYIDGKTLIHATVLPDNATNKAVIWSSSDSSVAMVKNGMVTACGEGTCKVTGTAEDGGFTANCNVLVQPNITINADITLTRRNIPLDHFWRTFEEILVENGEPFKIVHEFGGREVYWACINKYKSTMNTNLHVSLVNQKNCARVCMYIPNRNTPIGRVILANKESINNHLPFTPIWENGTKNPNTLRVFAKFPIDNHTPEELIETILPYAIEFIKVANTYGKNDFFDF